MVMFFRAVVVLLLAFASNAFAAAPTIKYEGSVYVPGMGLKVVLSDSPTAACGALAGATGLDLIACDSNPAAESGGVALRDKKTFENYSGAWIKKSVCSDGSSPVNGECKGTCELNAEPNGSGGCQCKAGFINREGVGCVADQCKANSGKVGVVNWTEGYTATPNEGDRAAIGGYNKPPSDGNICENGCMVSAQTSGAGVTFFVSQQPTANGLYRRSADFPTVALGTPCTASEKAANSPKAPEPKCEGTVGQVNGKTVCVSTPAAPVSTTPMPEPSTTPIAGNPAAGAAPTSGEGSGTGSTGRTPDAGTGGNGGGSASAGVGGKGGTAGGTASGTGTVKAPGAGEQQAACGAPGQPVCDVKVKEDGVEKLKAADSFKDADEELDKGKQTAKENRDKIAGTDDKGFFENFRSLWITPPLAACEPFVLPESVGSRTIDPCEVVDGVRSAMGYMWALGGLILCFGMIKRTI